MSPVGVEGQAERPGGAQSAVQLRVQTSGLPEFGEECLLRGVHVAGERGQFAAGPPYRVGVDDQARLVGGLQAEPDVPVLTVDRLDQPEARPNGSGHRVGLPPANQLR